MWTRTVDPRAAPDQPVDIDIVFEQGVPVELRVGGKEITDSLDICVKLNEIGREGSIGRIDIVEVWFRESPLLSGSTRYGPLGSCITQKPLTQPSQNRWVGLKSRGCYASPAMTILRLAYLDAEGLTLDGQVRSFRDQFVTHHWLELLCRGLYLSPEREFLENSLVLCQKRVVCGIYPALCR